MGCRSARRPPLGIQKQGREPTEALALGKDGVHGRHVLEVSKVRVRVKVRAALPLPLTWKLPKSCSRRRGSDETWTACPMKLAWPRVGVRDHLRPTDGGAVRWMAPRRSLG